MVFSMAALWVEMMDAM
jgi:hypothetical protein